jgi:hypothetical protein
MNGDNLKFMTAYDVENDRFMARLTWIDAKACHDVQMQFDPRANTGLEIVAILLPQLIAHVKEYNEATGAA